MLELLIFTQAPRAWRQRTAAYSGDRAPESKSSSHRCKRHVNSITRDTYVLRPRFPQKPQFGSTDLLVTVRGRALPPVRWKLSFTVPCQEGNAVRETSQTVSMIRSVWPSTRESEQNKTLHPLRTHSVCCHRFPLGHPCTPCVSCMPHDATPRGLQAGRRGRGIQVEHQGKVHSASSATGLERRTSCPYMRTAINGATAPSTQYPLVSICMCFV